VGKKKKFRPLGVTNFQICPHAARKTQKHYQKKVVGLTLKDFFSKRPLTRYNYETFCEEYTVRAVSIVAVKSIVASSFAAILGT
jgi:hypothetical protein